MIKPIQIIASNDVKKIAPSLNTLIDNAELINSDVFYYNVEVIDAFIEDDLENQIFLNIGDLLKLQPIFKKYITAKGLFQGSTLYYKLESINHNQQGVVTGIDEFGTIWIFVVDDIRHIFQEMYSICGIESEASNNLFLGNNRIPSFTTVSELLFALRNNFNLSNVALHRWKYKQELLFSKKPYIIPSAESGHYIVEIPKKVDFKSLEFQKRKSIGVKY